ncbi:MAG: fatty acid/phospholipid synthesis protein PlsX [Lachnospiraceae bacterium]|nr:fatty acid/phospholipid synthesis protein PlsX [Lachnospiraceae bacterium]
MELSLLFKSIVDQDNCPIVICDLKHTIVYMNPVADQKYAKHGGKLLEGRSIFDCHNEHSNELIRKVVEWFVADKSNNRVHTYFNKNDNKDVYMIALRDEDGILIGYYEKHEYRDVDSTPLYEMK